MRINHEKWNQDRLAVESKIIALKDSIRNGGERQTRAWSSDVCKYVDVLQVFGPGMGTAGDYERLEQLKFEATTLYRIRAYLRGRQHLNRVHVYKLRDGIGNEKCYDTIETVDFDPAEDKVFEENLPLAEYMLPDEVAQAQS